MLNVIKKIIEKRCTGAGIVDSSIRILSNILNTISKNEDINLLPFKDTSYIKAYINSEDNSLVVDGKLIMPYSFYCSFKSQKHIYNEMVNYKYIF